MAGVGSIYVSGHDVSIMQNPMNFDFMLSIQTEEALDDILRQCRDIKVKLMEGRIDEKN